MKILRFISMAVFIVFFSQFCKQIPAEEPKDANFEDQIIKVTLQKIIEDYERQKAVYADKMPAKISIAMVKQQDAQGQLVSADRIKKHWLYENGNISDLGIDARKTMSGLLTSTSVVDFAIFFEGDKATVQLDEKWHIYHAGGALYEVDKSPGGEISLKKLKDNWFS